MFDNITEIYIYQHAFLIRELHKLTFIHGINNKFCNNPIGFLKVEDYATSFKIETWCCTKCGNYDQTDLKIPLCCACVCIKRYN